MEKHFLKIVVAVLFTVLSVVLAQPVEAGFLDNFTTATQRLNSNTPQTNNAPTQQQGDADHPLDLTQQYKGHCNGQNTATCLDYGDVMDQCMAPVYGYRMKVLGDRIEYKLKNEQLTDQKRKSLGEDLAGAREAASKHSDDPTIAGETKSQRYLSDISDEDQIWVNAEYGRFRNRIMNKCEGADHMQTGHRTEFMTDFGPSGDEALAQYRTEHQAQLEKRKATNSCGAGIMGMRYTIMADMMEKKMQNLKLSDKERSDWQADIAAVREAGKAGGTTMPKVDDSANPYRPLTRLTTPDEQMALNTEFTKQSQAMMAACREKSGVSHYTRQRE